MIWYEMVYTSKDEDYRLRVCTFLFVAIVPILNRVYSSRVIAIDLLPCHMELDPKPFSDLESAVQLVLRWVPVDLFE